MGVQRLRLNFNHFVSSLGRKIMLNPSTTGPSRPSSPRRVAYRTSRPDPPQRPLPAYRSLGSVAPTAEKVGNSVGKGLKETVCFFTCSFILAT